MASVVVRAFSHYVAIDWSGAKGSHHKSIAMAVVEDGFNMMGETLYVPMPDETIEVEVTGTVFYDPKGEKLNG